MFFKNSSAKKEKEIKNTEGEEGEGKSETEREPCEQCGSLEHIACIRPF